MIRTESVTDKRTKVPSASGKGYEQSKVPDKKELINEVIQN